MIQIAALLISSLLTLSCSTVQARESKLPPLKTVAFVDLDRYLGQWYEIARYPNSFQKGCDQATAQYSLTDDGDIRVLNTCINLKTKKPQTAEGLATVKDPFTHAKLKVSFLPPWLRWTGLGRGDYWVIDLASDYSYSVVSEPKRKYLWILSRTATLPADVYQKILDRLTESGFDIKKLINSRPQ